MQNCRIHGPLDMDMNGSYFCSECLAECPHAKRCRGCGTVEMGRGIEPYCGACHDKNEMEADRELARAERKAEESDEHWTEVE